ncbi:hypothetical protein RJ640_017571 [Escallonia rubra]|uniref:Bulb-type lectin domain-containing protein n=1 Tax=Escallonia rubra TaxID=112253 RepID=A0AA88UMY7_9ASTE|nr:hypothetical protein RJ640_017571 [Escallonia rubra]
MIEVGENYLGSISLYARRLRVHEGKREEPQSLTLPEIPCSDPSLFCLKFCTSTDTTTTHFIKDHETNVSNSTSFQLGFFGPSLCWYLVQRTRPERRWVANRDQRLTDTLGAATILEDGNLVVLDGQHQIIWSSNVTSSMAKSNAQLLDTGNLVLQDQPNGRTLWQSFQHPSDIFIGVPSMDSAHSNGFDLGREDDGSAYLTFCLADKSIIGYFVWGSEGRLVQKVWDDGAEEWEVTWTARKDDCDVYDKKKSMNQVIAITTINGSVIVVISAYIAWSMAKRKAMQPLWFPITGTELTDASRNCINIFQAWKLWNEEEIVKLVDPRIAESCFQMEILRYIHVGLLCVQEVAKDRPIISVILSMLSSVIEDLSTPREPAFTVKQTSSEADFSQQSQTRCSVNDTTAAITAVTGDYRGVPNPLLPGRVGKDYWLRHKIGSLPLSERPDQCRQQVFLVVCYK